MAVRDCTSTDQAWSIREDDNSVDTYTIQNVNGGDNGFLSLYEGKSFNLSDGSSSYAQWSFQVSIRAMYFDGARTYHLQSETPPKNVAWDVCAYVSGPSSSSTSGSSSSSPAASTQAVLVTASSTLSASSGGSGSSDAATASLETSTVTEERFSAEATAAATSQSPSVAASGISTLTGATQASSSSVIPQSNDAGTMKVAWYGLLTALIIGAYVASS